MLKGKSSKNRKEIQLEAKILAHSLLEELQFHHQRLEVSLEKGKVPSNRSTRTRINKNPTLDSTPKRSALKKVEGESLVKKLYMQDIKVNYFESLCTVHDGMLPQLKH